MIKETIKYPRFSETDFIRLYCAINFQKGLSPIIKHHELETKLYEFYSLPDFEELFQDICPKKDYINPKNSYFLMHNLLINSLFYLLPFLFYKQFLLYNLYLLFEYHYFYNNT